MNDDDKDRDDERRTPFDDFFEQFFGFPGKKTPFNEIFKEFDEIFERFQRDLEHMKPHSPKEGEKKKNYTYGFNIFIGPDGKPKVREFGNLKPHREGVVKKEKYEPSSSTYTEDGKVSVVVNLPGVEKEQINANVGKKEVEISAKGEDREYYKKIKLPKKVIPDSAKAQYENGVLSLTLDTEEEEDKKTIEIE